MPRVEHRRFNLQRHLPSDTEFHIAAMKASRMAFAVNLGIRGNEWCERCLAAPLLLLSCVILTKAIVATT
jgi:hypothetical protein